MADAGLTGVRLLIGATLVDGTGAPPVPDAAVLIAGGRIAAAGPRATVCAPAEAEVIEASGLTVLPGLIDCHDHLGWHGRELAPRWGLTEPASTRHLRTAAVLRGAVRSGYTTIRDAGGLDAGFKAAIDEGLAVGPRLVLAISIISAPGGIGDRVSGSGHEYVEGDPALPNGVASGAGEIRRVVRRMVRAGADVIKGATTGGATSRPGHGPKDAGFSRDELRALVDEAHAHGRRVMCHALGGQGLRWAVEAGVDSIEHGAYLSEDPDLAAMMAERGIFLVPTFTDYALGRVHGAAHVQARIREFQRAHVESVRQALAAGVRIAAGSDAGSQARGVNAQELAHLVAAGLSPMQALQAATGRAAECLGLEAEIGSLVRGKAADLVLVDGDPLADIAVLQDPRRIALVLKGGDVVVDRRPRMGEASR